MDKDTRIVEKLQVYELQEIIANAPKHYFKAAVREACLQINKDCEKKWTNGIHNFMGEITGKDTRDIENRDHIGSVYKYAEGQQDKSKLIGRTAIIKSIEAGVIALLVYFGLKLS